jgi:alkylation response protein AidB-like acyl-CoA dehydrogenase
LFDELLAFCRATGDSGRLIDDPLVADRVAELWTRLQEGRRCAVRLVAEELAGERTAVSASRAKVVLTELSQRLTQSATEIVGPDASIDGTLFGPAVPAAPARGRFGYEYLFRFDGSIAVGANEIHRSGIAAALGVRTSGEP